MTPQLTIAALEAELAERDQALQDLQAEVRALKAERDALRNAEAGQLWSLQSMAVDAPVPIAVLDGESLAAKWSNSAWQRLMSRDREPTLPGLSEITTHADPIEVARRLAQSNTPYHRGEFEQKAPDADAKYWRCTFLLLPTEQGRISDVMVLVADVTADKAMEESLRQARTRCKTRPSGSNDGSVNERPSWKNSMPPCALR